MPTSKNDNNRASPLAADLHPAYFAMVMATGIVSVAAQLRDGQPGANAAVAKYFLLRHALVLTLLRFVRYRDRLVADLLSHGQSVGFFTMVAATCVLGNQFVVVLPWPQVALTLWIVGIALWAIITYTVLTGLTVKSSKAVARRGHQRRLAGDRCRGPICVGSWRPDRAEPRRASRTGIVLRFDHVARRRNALYLDHLVDLLPLYFFRARSTTTGAALLDQHGRDGHFDARRNNPGPKCNRLAAFGRVAAASLSA